MKTFASQSRRTAAMSLGPQTPFAQQIHAEKYRGPGETFRDAMNRVANALADDENHFRSSREILLDMRFMPGGRVQAAVGAPKRVTPYNCYVSGTIEDSFVEGDGNIMQRATEAAATMRMGGGIGYDFSTLRPRGDLIKKLDSKSSGPIEFMKIFDAVCKCVASSGHRRGAQMGVLRIDHPDIEEFIHAKNNSDALTGFNVSIGVTDEFMECLEEGRPFPLKFEGRVYKHVDAQLLWDMIMRSTWDWAEPGVLFIDTINKENNLWYCEQIAATNPCGEQPLPPHGACLLGSFNLVRYLRKVPDGVTYLPDYPPPPYMIDWELLKKDIPIVVRMMDNVVDRAIYPLPEQEAEARSKRRMGLGLTGVANALEACGTRYGEPAFVALLEQVMRVLRDECYRASANLAAEKEPFPLYSDEYLLGEFTKRLPGDVRQLIAQNGIRNSHLISIAPTGTISLAADNVSSGIEPVFSYGYDRIIKTFDGEAVERIEDYGVRFLGIEGKTADKVTVYEHLDVLEAAQKYCDSAVSKTCNVGSEVTWYEFKEIYAMAHGRGCKGCTTFRADGKRFGILHADKDEDQEALPEIEEGASCFIDPVTGRRECG
jgi:ribonucleoside-diphosphate reductase alpha chain